MIINDIEYAIRFWVETEDGEEIADEVFQDLNEMNKYIKRTWKDPRFFDVKATFSPVEVINGKPEEAVTFLFEIFPYLELDEDEIEDYLSDIQDAYDEAEALGKHCGKETKFIPSGEAENYEEKKTCLAEISYICPHCYRELNDCRCSEYPYYLVQIDKLMVPIIRTLNNKGYITTACCSGHADIHHGLTIYVEFEKEHNFGTNMPKGSVYAKTGRTVSYPFDPDIEKEEFIVFQKECIEKFTAWAENLPKL